MVSYYVIDNITNKEADIKNIVSSEEWTYKLLHCDRIEFALLSKGELILFDEYGHFAYCPDNRFRLVFCKTNTLLDYIGG